MLTSGRILKMSLAAVDHSGVLIAGASAAIVVNGVKKDSYEVKTMTNLYPHVVKFETPLEVFQGDMLTFTTTSTNNRVVSEIATLLIELGM